MNMEILKKAEAWTSEEYDIETRKEIQELIDTGNEKELIDRFWKDLEFGTGGLRGIRGAGSNRMNVYNIKKVTQGLANYLKKQAQNGGVVIGRDSRIFSLEFAQVAASVLVANGIPVYFFKDLCPTPILSYSISKLNAQAGIMNTASHNPKEYNGYKVFWSDGGQLIPPHDNNVIEEVNAIASMSEIKDMEFSDVEKSNLFRYCDEYIDIYLEEALLTSKNKDICQHSDLKIVYSPLHGCGYKATPKLLEKFGFKNIVGIDEQNIPDGNFPSAPYPNPEDPKAMELGIQKLNQIDGDVFIATDPDADRIGVAYKNSKGEIELLNGNQIGVLLVDYLIQNTPIDNTFIVSTIVSTPLVGKIAAAHNIDYAECLTGFRWIASISQALEKENKKLLFSFEESHGYNTLNSVRDKDGVLTTALFCELSAYHKKQGKTLDMVLLDIGIKYGYHKESQVSLSYEGAEGAIIIKKIMENLRIKCPQKIGKIGVSSSIDYLDSSKTKLPQSDVYSLLLENGARIVARPSGTEPKIKFYISTNGKIGCAGCIPALDKEHEQLKNDFISFIKETNSL